MDDDPTSSHARGYKRLADLMAWNPSGAIFSRFRAANALNLLGLQAEICRIQGDLARLVSRDESQNEDPIRKRYQFDWSALQDGEKGNNEQYLKIKELREKLSEYNTALVQQITINQQPNPSHYELRFLEFWLRDMYGGASELRGSDSDIWFTREGKDYKLDDKVAIWQQTSYDPMTKLVLSALAPISPYLPVKKRSFPARELEGFEGHFCTEKKDFDIYSTTSALVSATNSIVTVLCCLIITVPIIILNYTPSTAIRLGIIVISAFVFSSCLILMSDATRKDVFAATAAFVAVQVVFVGSVGNPSTGN